MYFCGPDTSQPLLHPSPGPAPSSPAYNKAFSYLPSDLSALSPCSRKVRSGMWSPGIRRFPEILATAPTIRFCLCLTHCRRGAGGIWGHISTQNSVLPVPLLGEVPRDGPTGAPPSSFSFPWRCSLLSCPSCDGGERAHGGWAGPCASDQNPTYAFQAKKSLMVLRAASGADLRVPSAPALHFVPVSRSLHAPAYFVANWFLHMEENRATESSQV